MTICWAKNYNLPSIDIFNDNGTISEAGGLYVGMDRFDVRKQIEKRPGGCRPDGKGGSL